MLTVDGNPLLVGSVPLVTASAGPTDDTLWYFPGRLLRSKEVMSIE